MGLIVYTDGTEDSSAEWELTQKRGRIPPCGTRPRFNQHRPGLFRQRIGAQLEVNDLAHLAFAALDVSGSPIGEGGPQSLALPTRSHVVEAPVHALGEIADGVWHAHHNP